MAVIKSAGVLMYRLRGTGVEVFLVHPGGPYHARRDAGAWTIPKGEIEEGEDALAAACREFEEETGFRPEGPFTALEPVMQRNGKRVQAWAAEGDVDPARLRSNLFAIEWPPHSGRREQFPEADRGGWFSLSEARAKLLAGQQPLLAQLEALLGSAAPAVQR
jgi:predicted NUDIX family NTP pyrophosphohydrolase